MSPQRQLMQAMALVAKVTGWPPETLLSMGEAEFGVYLDFALRMHGVKADEGYVAPPPAADSPVMDQVPDAVFQRLSPEAQAHLRP